MILIVIVIVMVIIITIIIIIMIIVINQREARRGARARPGEASALCELVIATTGATQLDPTPSDYFK